ncbi:DUF948 domain-containing protein [Tuberibacillus sp. Marseille-P3662]|uniref:DUF948 domain-containing protein n=1 Tax=Tuberibacillus sp. Marseille-P3662 TaxID=1965358 RepID=UPI000A1CA515|nr:DUF948 domain-containing protein [Tuberibacillus sp. Marseille-P3662]
MAIVYISLIGAAIVLIVAAFFIYQTVRRTLDIVMRLSKTAESMRESVENMNKEQKQFMHRLDKLNDDIKQKQEQTQATVQQTKELIRRLQSAPKVIWGGVKGKVK